MSTRVALVLATGLLLATTTLLGAQETRGTDEQAIKDVVVTAYVNGVFNDRDAAAVRVGFHPDFVMSVHAENGLIVATLDMWLERLGLDGTPSPSPVDHQFRSVDITGNTALVKLDIYEADSHRYTDYLGLYRFSDGWLIVNKVFQSH
ncbi:MAG: nuclear transport factor 2 family protein [Candidatus Palauibacterales bacterium]|nr:nuclear transport factor 2 family protein [Candidatus Palauibacterales bacterium]